MKKFEILLVVNNKTIVTEKLIRQNNINLYSADDEEQAIEKMQALNIDIIIYEGAGDFAIRNKLKSLKQILAPNAVIIEYDERNINALPDDLEIAMQKVNANYDGGPRFYDGPEINKP